MRNYEVTFIVDPVLSGDEIKATAQTYVDALKSEGCKIVHIDEMGLRQLAYPINRRTTGVYYCVEFEAPNGELIPKLELSLRRDERIMRFLSFKLDKYGVKYNEDKRNGLIGKVVKKDKKSDKDNRRHGRSRSGHSSSRSQSSSSKQPVAKKPAPQVMTAVKTAVATEVIEEIKSEEE